MADFKIHFTEINQMTQIVEAESVEQALQRWRDRDEEHLWEDDCDGVETRDAHKIERLDGDEWKEVEP